MLTMFKEFMADEDAWTMYVRGPAGSGKTTKLDKVVRYCEAEEIPYLVVAFTHKACEILASKLPKGTRISTLHSFLKKRPGINEHATKKEHIQINTKVGDIMAPRLLIIDEDSFVGIQDALDIQAAQDPEYTGKPFMKVLSIGDPNQLPPVGSVPAIKPEGKYVLRLTKIYRQAGDNPLMDILSKLVNFIEEVEPPSKLPDNPAFHRECDLLKVYQEKKGCTFLAYTNKAVEEWNALIAGHDFPYNNKDIVYSPDTRQSYMFHGVVDKEDIKGICRPWDDDLGFNSKYKTLEHLMTMSGIHFMHVTGEEDGEEYMWAAIFGHHQYKVKLKELGEAAALANRNIENQFKQTAKNWAMMNQHHKLARARAKAWRDYMTFKECVICLDFPYAMTIHKSQGSTYDNVCLDVKDLAMCATKDYELYLKLLYVATSRARFEVFTN